ncbi:MULTISPECIES: hypothetical protein [unclassified Nocardiopsis]|uniref:hypothetical protein n=1 Tax=unclassified Nocardiopsis TaxID=2649073 RepID=UPI0013597700|nr:MULTISPECIES: hypothetical protein [unclassified Nocardiopsis]
MARSGGRDDRGEEGEGGVRRRIDLSASQVAGAGAATLAAATAASYLNVYGTVIGAAVMAALSTLVSPLLQHWFTRGGEQARQLAGRAVGQTGEPVPHAPGAPVAPAPEGISETALLRGTAAVPEADATRTAALRPEGGDPADPAPGAEAPRDGAVPVRRRGRRSPAVSAVVVFVLVMLLILVFELFTGRSLTTWTRGDDGASAPTLFGGTASAPPAEEDREGTGDADTVQEEPGAAVPGRQDAPGTAQPTAPATGEPGDDGAPEDGGAASPDPAEEPGGDSQDSGGQDPGTGTGGQDGQDGQEPAPEPVVPDQG